MTETEFAELATRIRNALSCGRDLASDYAKAIGERPVVENGKVLVRDEGGRVIAYIPQGVLQ